MDLNEHLFIVFCVEHYNPLGIVRSLGEAGFSSNVIVIKNKRRLVSRSKYVQCIDYVETIDEGFQLLIEKYGNAVPSPFLYTADDKIESYLDEHYDELVGKFYFFNAGNNGDVTYYMNKENINNLARKHGLNVLDTWVVKRGEIPDDLNYPIITKSIASTVGGWKEDVFICNNSNELEDAYSKIQSEIILLQHYIEKKNELCLDGISYNKGKNYFVSIATNYKYVLKDTYSQYMTIHNFDCPSLKGPLADMFEEIGFEGIFSVEFLIDQEDKLYFCEINFRNSTWSYASTKAGMNLPFLWAYAMKNNCLPVSYQKQVKEDFTAMVEFDDYVVRVKKGKMAFYNWIKECVNSDCTFYFAKNDIKPFISVFTNKIKRLME